MNFKVTYNIREVNDDLLIFFLGLVSLRELYLQGNLIKIIHNKTFHTLTQLEILNLEGMYILYPKNCKQKAF